MSKVLKQRSKIVVTRRLRVFASKHIRLCSIKEHICSIKQIAKICLGTTGKNICRTQPARWAQIGPKLGPCRRLPSAATLSRRHTPLHQQPRPVNVCSGHNLLA
jgi:hypothetical protein